MDSQDALALRWLHITDLHVGVNSESQRTALTSLLQSVEKNAAGKPFDLVVLSGDLAFSGEKEQYLLLEQQIILPMKRSPLFSGATFVAAPGNHDMNCEVGLPISWKSLGKNRQEKFFHLGEEGQKLRGSRANSMKEYSEFVRRCGILSVDPCTEPAAAFRVTKGDQVYVIVSAVTCFFSDLETSDEKQSPAPVHSIRSLLLDVKPEEQILVVGHHPLEWFLFEFENQLYGLIVEKNALYLHGHEHRPKPRFGPRGLTALGFGAAYQAASETVPRAYRNSYAICELSDRLDISMECWDAVHGQWRSEQLVPADFRDKSTRLTDGFSLIVPRTLVGERRRPYSVLETAIREELEIERCEWLATNDIKRWSTLLGTIGVVKDSFEPYALPSQPLPRGHTQFRLVSGETNLLVYAVSAYGDILHHEQIRSVNTELDRQAYDGCYVLTLGEMSDDAETLAAQLGSRKPITILKRSDVLRKLLRNLPTGLGSALVRASEDERDLAGTLIVADHGFAALIEERHSAQWFQVVNDSGNIVPEVDEIVLRLRQEHPKLRAMRYAPGRADAQSAAAGVASGKAEFLRDEYLKMSHAHFDAVKYAPLAALGMRFRKASLSEIYIQASADVGGTTKASQGLNRAVNEFVESLNLPKAQQDQLESQLRSKYGLNRSAEVGAARNLYQRYNNVVVLGDPGSGKTCFVQYEILAYCSPPSDWYSKHLPVYVSLAEAARLHEPGTSLIQICEIVAARRGARLPARTIEEFLVNGRVAFFFDGLDEVGLIDKRIALLSEIDSLVDMYAPRGNRFVLTSRPAAVQPVDIPEGLTYLQLKGLAEDEMRTLASRVLTARLGEGEVKTLSQDEEDLVERLLDDTREQPGIARIARNPLLLTLLVLVYANSGALSARRHLVYTHAVKTLVSVRGRQTREQQISESDLRTRLGALALAIFRRSVAEIPRRKEVIRLLAPLFGSIQSNRDRGTADAVDEFIQEVSEATGLLVIHPNEDDKSQDLVTFMHYSFLEYYASAGLLANDHLQSVPLVAANPRWRDVVTLLFGMLSETNDVTSLLRKVLEPTSDGERITQYRLLLALDCACECDVPPEGAQDCMAAAVFEAMSVGPARYSEDLRGDIAERLEDLLQIATPRFERILVQGLSDERVMVAAAFSDLIGRIAPDVPISLKVVDAFEKFLAVEEPVARASAMRAIEKRPEFRGGAVEPFVARTLKGTIVEKLAALKAVAAVPALLEALWEPIVSLLDDTNPMVAATAAKCVLVSTIRHPEKLEQQIAPRALSRLQQSSEGVGIELRGVTLDKNVIGAMVSSDDEAECELAIRHVHMIKGDARFAYDVVISKLRQERSARVSSACLDALRDSPGAINLITLADTDYVCSLLERNHRNVRISAVMLLGDLPDDEQVVRSLQAHLDTLAEKGSEDDELTETARALAKHVRRNARLREGTLERLLEQLPKGQSAEFGDSKKQQHTLAVFSVCEAIGGVDDRVAWKMRDLYEDFRAPAGIRRSALRLFGRLAQPSIRGAKEVTRLLSVSDSRWNEAVYTAAHSFIFQARKKVEYVRAIYPEFELLKASLCAAWDKEASRSGLSIAPSGLRDLREAIIEVDKLMASYGEFAERATVDS